MFYVLSFLLYLNKMFLIGSPNGSHPTKASEGTLQQTKIYPPPTKTLLCKKQLRRNLCPCLPASHFLYPPSLEFGMTVSC